jgi:zinc protease
VLRIESDRMRDVLDLQSQWENERGAIEQEVLRDEVRAGRRLLSRRARRSRSRARRTRAKASAPWPRSTLTGPESNEVLRALVRAQQRRARDRGRRRQEALCWRKCARASRRFPRRPIPAHPVVRFAPLERTVIRRPTSLTYPLAVLAFRFPGVDSPDFLPSYLLQKCSVRQRGPLQSLVDSGEALEARVGLRPVFSRRPTRLGDRRARAGRDPYDDQASRRILRDYARTACRRTVRDDEAPGDRRQELSRNSISALANDWATTIALDGEPSIAREQQLLAK